MLLPDDARFSTVCIHAGQTPDPTTGAIITPIYQTSTYVQEELGRHKGYEYARTQNPTRAALEANLAAIEGGRAGFAFASGMAAIDAITKLLSAGDHVIVTDNTYGGTFRLFDKVLTRYGLTFSYVDTSQLDQIEAAITPQTRMLFLETPTNPVLRLTDIAAAGGDCPPPRHRDGGRQHLREPQRAAADRARRRPGDPQHHQVPERPQRQRRRDRHRGPRRAHRGAAASSRTPPARILSPFDSWLVLRGTKTLAVRMAQHNANGMALAQHLSGHPGSSGSSIRAFRTIRSTSWRSGRCAGSAGW